VSQKLTPEQIMAVLEQQAREDAAVEAEIQAVAALTDAQLDEELRRAGLDLADLEAQAEALFQEGQAQPPVQAVAQDTARALADRPRRRRPAAVAVWLAAGAAAATAGGALLYSLTHRQPEAHPVPEPSTPAPSPSPSSAPLPTNLVATTPAELRAAAATALDQGRPEECLRLLDSAKQGDPAGDATPEIKNLRDRAASAVGPKPPKP
jgi:hypothetical protein